MPPALIRRLEKIIGGSALDGFLAGGGTGRRSLRVNALKAGYGGVRKALAEKGFGPECIPWCDMGLFVEDRPGLDDTVEYFLGHYYIQDAASMVPALALAPTEDDVVLDLAASPGGKTTQIAGLMGGKGVIIANEYNPGRLGALRFNLNKYGVANAVVTTMDATARWVCKTNFSKILLDAPCSCEGQVNNPEAQRHWSIGKVRRCSQIQKKMIENAARLLTEGGTLVYSTCTLAPEENEEVVDHILGVDGSLKAEEIEMKGLKTHPGLDGWNGREYSPCLRKTIRINPRENNTDGFYIAKLVKCKN